MKKTRQRKRNRKRSLLKPGMILLVGIAILLLVMKVFQIGLFSNRYQEIEGEKVDAYRPDIQVELLTPNKYSRPQTKTERINNIVIHYTANPGATAQQNRDYFDGLKDTHLTQASSHFIVGLNGEIIQCIPTWEMAYASNNRNQDTVSIECCHPNESGRFNWKTYRSMVELSAWLCLKFGLTEENLIRHYDVTGKNCPKYFVEHPEKWNEFRSDVGKSLEKMK
nr:peptidoglycan recognition family protein [uncultured Sellimonas sp.]